MRIIFFLMCFGSIIFSQGTSSLKNLQEKLLESLSNISDNPSYVSNTISEEETIPPEHIEEGSNPKPEAKIFLTNTITNIVIVTLTNTQLRQVHQTNFIIQSKTVYLEDRGKYAALTFLFPGLGQFQNKEPLKGVILGGLFSGSTLGSIAFFVLANQSLDEAKKYKKEAESTFSSTLRNSLFEKSNLAFDQYNINYTFGVSFLISALVTYVYAAVDTFIVQKNYLDLVFDLKRNGVNIVFKKKF